VMPTTPADRPVGFRAVRGQSPKANGPLDPSAARFLRRSRDPEPPRPAWESILAAAKREMNEGPALPFLYSVEVACAVDGARCVEKELRAFEVCLEEPIPVRRWAAGRDAGSGAGRPSRRSRWMSRDDVGLGLVRLAGISGACRPVEGLNRSPCGLSRSS